MIKTTVITVVGILMMTLLTPSWSPAARDGKGDDGLLSPLWEYEEQLAGLCASARKSVVQIEAHYPMRYFDERGREVKADSDEKKFTIRPPRSVASGFFMTEGGHIVTLAGSVAAAERIVVRLPDGDNEYEAQVVGVDRETGIAVIKIDGEGFSPVKTGKSSDLRQGHVVASVGNPFGLRGTVSFGTISGLDRSIRTSTMAYSGLMQCTAPAYPGDSGGLIVNSRGEAVGIIISTYRSAAEGLRGQLKTALAMLEDYDALTDPERGGRMSDEEFIKEFRKRLEAMTRRQREIIKNLRLLEASLSSYAVAGNTETLTFAVPLDSVADVIRQLIKTGRVARPLLGVKVREIDDEYRELHGMRDAEGVLVEQVIEGSPAQKAGIIKGDILLAVDGCKVSTLPELRKIMAGRKPGDKISVTLLRGEAREKIEIEITLSTK